MPGVWQVLTDNFTVLRKRDMRVYLTGNGISLVGDWMQQTAQAWVVWQLTHSATALGVVAFFSQLPFFLFGPWVGVLSDRYDRRKILLVTQVLIMACAFILALLVETSLLKLWHVYVLAFFLGVVSAFDVTAEQAFIADIAGEGNIRKAIALNNSLTQLTRLVGPALSGYLIARVGVATSFWLNGVSLFACIICLLAVHSRAVKEPVTGKGMQQFREGWRFFIRHPILRLIVVFAGAQAFFGLSTIQLLPAIASVVLKGDSNTLGRLLGAAGAGALAGILVVLPFLQQMKRSCIAIGGALIWSGAWYVAFSFTHTLWLAMVCQCMASLGAANVVTLSIGLAQEMTPPGMRARVLSVFLMIIFGLQPVASYLIGASADRIGLQAMILINGVFMMVIPVLLLTAPRLRKYRRGADEGEVKDHCVGF
ncbi:MAG TPA: MFS transporter [Puia sp.]|jgi:MFS family permease